jgi:hypothetical protein
MFFVRRFARFLELTKAQFLQHAPVIPVTNPTPAHILQQRFSRILRRVQLDPLRLITVHRLPIRQPPHHPLTVLLLHPPLQIHANIFVHFANQALRIFSRG